MMTPAPSAERLLRLQTAIDMAYENLLRAKELERQAKALLMEAEGFLRRTQRSSRPKDEDDS